MNDPTSTVDIKLDAAGNGHVIVNGEDVSARLEAVQLIAERGVAPRVMLHSKAGIDLSVEGVVHVVGNSNDAIIAFLDEVNPDELEAAALMREGAIPVAFLETLKELAKTWQAST